jgi:hypothetical protein
VVKLLIKTDDVEMGFKDHYGRTPLLYATATKRDLWMMDQDQEAAIELLFKKDCVEVNAADVYGQMVLL